MARAQMRNAWPASAIDRLRGLTPAARIVLGCVAMAVVVAYCVGCVYFHQRFWPHTTMGGVDVSLMDAPSAREAFERSTAGRSVSLSGQGVSLQLTGARAGLEFNAEGAVEEALAKAASWQWPLQVLLAHDSSDALLASFDETLLLTTLVNELAPFNKMTHEVELMTAKYSEAEGNLTGEEILAIDWMLED